MSNKYVSLPVTRNLALGIEAIEGELRLLPSTADQLAALMNAGLEIRLSMCVERRPTGLQIRCVSFSPVPAGKT